MNAGTQNVNVYNANSNSNYNNDMTGKTTAAIAPAARMMFFNVFQYDKPHDDLPCALLRCSHQVYDLSHVSGKPVYHEKTKNDANSINIFCINFSLLASIYRMVENNVYVTPLPLTRSKRRRENFRGLSLHLLAGAHTSVRSNPGAIDRTIFSHSLTQARVGSNFGATNHTMRF